MISKKILKNTAMLYFRQILMIVVSLYSIRVVLNTLGIEEYGIYSVVAGVVTLGSFITNTMSSATQRFFSYALGKQDNKLLNTTFSVNLITYIGIGLFVLLILETVGLWFVRYKLNLPTDRFDSAVLVYHYSVFAFIFSIITAPFMAIIIAHEDMHYFALISIVEALMKLGVVFLLLYLPWDKLELYGLLLLMVSFTIAMAHLIICNNKYKECQFRKIYWDSSLVSSIFSFTGWTLFGQVSTVARMQAVTILLNQFFNPTVVAARTIAITVATQVNLFANNFNTGLYPSIIKSYASNKNDELYSLLYSGSKLSFFLLWVFALPLYIEMDFVLTLWLGELPQQVVLFVKLALIESLILSVSLPIGTAARAPGRMKEYEVILGSMQLAILPISYLTLYLGYAAYSVFVVAIIMNVVMFFVRLKIVSKLIGLPKSTFLQKVCLPLLLMVTISSLLSFFVKSLLPFGMIYSFLSVFSTVLICCVCAYYLCLDIEWRIKVKSYLLAKLKSFGVTRV
jgi:O-antigen/teichoic acid export membrane protein